MINFISNNLIEFTFIASIIILLIVSHWISAYKNHKNKKITLKEAQNDENSFKNYVKRYYVTNLPFTILAVFLYIIASLSFMIYLRFKTVQNYTVKQANFPIDTAFTSFKNPAEDLVDFLYLFGPLIIYFILLIGTFIAFKVFIHFLLFDEVLKLHLYLHNNLLYLHLQDITHDQYLRNFFGSCYLFFYNISRLKALPIIDGLEDSNDFNMYNTIYETQTILNLSFKCVTLAENYIIFHKVFKFLEYIFKFLYRHLNYDGFALYIPYIIYISIFIYDFLSLQFYYSFYLIFPMFIVYIWRQFILFMNSRSGFDEYPLYDYFYNKSKTSRNFSVLTKTYVLDGFKNIYKGEDAELIRDLTKKSNAMYQRYFLIVISGILASIVIKQNLYSVLIVPLYLKIPMSIIISILLISTIYCSINTFKLPKDKKDKIYYLGNYIYSRTYNILFWILILIQLYLYWLLIVKNILFIIYDNVVWEQVNIRVIHNYTVEETLKLLYDYFDKIVIQIELPEDQVIILKQFITHLDLKDVITDYTRLSELKKFFTITLLEDYLKCQQYWEELAIKNAIKHAAITILMIYLYLKDIK